MELMQRSETIVTKFVDDDAGGLRLEQPTKDPINDRARVGQAIVLRREQEKPRDVFHVSWERNRHSPDALEIDGKSIGLFFQGDVYDQSDTLIGRYHRLGQFRLDDEDADQEAVLFLF